MSHTYRVVVDDSRKPTFNGASGLYATKDGAKGALLDIARTWVGLYAPELRADGSFVITTDSHTLTYSILAERKAPAFQNTPFGFEGAQA